jgi:hypothetical protein
MERRLYIPDTNSWLEYFDRSNGRGNRTGLTVIGTGQWGGGVANFRRMQTTHITPLSACAKVSKDKEYAEGGNNNKKKNYKNATKVEITSQTRDVLERAEADVKRKRKINRQAGERLIIQSKKSRKESNFNGKVSKAKFEKVRASDIFS